jgi:Zn-dependent metalloprotease
VANHFFFLLAHGSQVDPLSENEQSPMANGVARIDGIGNDKAGRIWYRALTSYMTSSTSYSGARAATLSAARDLHGQDSPEYQTVALAWKAVNLVKSPPAFLVSGCVSVRAPPGGQVRRR